jgi:protein-S-isoprenylcysteine O-methyltransferase Ste14
MATVSLYIRQENDPIQIRKEISWNTLSLDDMGYLIKRGFYSVTNTFVSILQWLVVILVGYSPLWIILAIGVFLWFMLRKRKKERERERERDN